MIINDVQFNCTLEEILSELQAQLRLNNIPLLQKIADTTNDIMVQCPYHGNGQERRPSAGIRKSDGLFHCFACQETHSLTEVIAHCFGHDDPFSAWGWKWLNRNFATITVEERGDIELDLTRHMNKPIEPKYISEEELDKYRYHHPYMTKRGLTEEMIYLFDVGYDTDTKCITFPVRDINGNCLFVARRSVKTKYFNYPAGAEKPLYGLYEYNLVKDIADARESEMNYGIDFTTWDKSIVIVCESMLDAITAWTFNRYAVAMNGLGTDLQFKQLRELPCRQIILATDNDSAGMRARERIRKNVTNKIITEYQFPDGVKDLNDLANTGLDVLQEYF